MVKGYSSVLEPSAWRLSVRVEHGDVDTLPSGPDGVMTAELYVTVGSKKLIHVIDEVDDVTSILDGVDTHFLDKDGYVVTFEDLFKMCGRCKEEEVVLLCDCEVKERKDGKYRVVLTDGVSPISDAFLLTKEELDKALSSCDGFFYWMHYPLV